MAGTREYFFEPDVLIRLLTHYSDGAVPMNGEVVDFLVHPIMDRKIGLNVLSDEWDNSEPLQIHYDGRRISSWQQGDGDLNFQQKNETPKLQLA